MVGRNSSITDDAELTLAEPLGSEMNWDARRYLFNISFYSFSNQAFEKCITSDVNFWV